MIDLDEHWKRAFFTYDQLKTSSESAVVRREWTSSPRYDLRPEFFRRYQQSRGRVLKAEPANKEYCHEYGFDAQDRLVFARVYRTYPDLDQSLLERIWHGMRYSLVFTEEFFTYGDGWIEAVDYSFFKPKIPFRVTHQVMQNGLPLSSNLIEYSIGPDVQGRTPDELIAWISSLPLARGWLTETYHYTGDKLIRVRVEGQRASMPYVVEEHLDYNAAGKLERITAHEPDGSKRPLYQKPRRGQTVKTLGETFKRRLVEAIPSAIAGAGITEPIYCIVLGYQYPELVPPNLMLLLGLESDRQTILAQNPIEARYTLWMPVFPMIELHVIQAGEIFQQEIALHEKWDQGERVLDQAAAELMQIDWTGIAPVTSDLVIYAADYEISVLEDRMAASVPAERLAELRVKGWL